MITSLVCVLVLALLFHFDHAQYVTLLPKSITTAIGMGISEELGGYVTITVAVIIITGVIGNMHHYHRYHRKCVSGNDLPCFQN